jgi:hypothetical protein
MTRLFTALPIAIAALMVAGVGPAAAQVAGVYSGTSMDGNGITLDVSTDTGTGLLAVTGASIGFSALCSDGSTLNSGWGYGLTQDILNRKVKNTTAGYYFTITFDVTFSRDGQSATGTISTVSPTLSPVGAKPKKALFCTSASQPLGLTLQADGAKVRPPVNGAVMTGKLVHAGS